MAKIKNEDLRLNIIVNGDAGRKEILALERSMKDTNAAIKATEREMKSLKKAGKENSDEYKSLNSKLEAHRHSLAETRTKYDELQSKISLTNKTIDELRKHISATRAVLNKATPGTEQWKALNEELNKSRIRLYELTNGAEATHSTLCQLAARTRDYIISAGAIVNTVKGLYDRGSAARDAFLEYDEAMVDAMKTTGLARSQMESLSSSLKEIDTKTAQNELLALVRAGGKLGITGKKDLLGFARAADQINVALSEDLGGNAEAAITAIGKMTDIFGLKDEFGIEQAMLKVGSAINELGMASTANEGYIVDFSKRLAGIAPNADISISKVLGLAATLDKYGQQSETSATAIGQTIMAMFKRTETFADIAGMAVKDFSELLKTDVNEALLRVLEGMQKGEGGLASVTAAMEEMHLNGQRAATVLGTLSKNTGELRAQQELANQAFNKGTSLTEEFSAKNTSLSAKLEKQRKSIHDVTVEIGERLNPAMSFGLNLAEIGLKTLSATIATVIKCKVAIGLLTAAILVYTKTEQARIVIEKIKHFYSKQNRADLALEATLLNGSTKATMLKCGALNLLAGNLKAAGTAFKAFGVALKANPLGAILTGLSLVVGGIKLLTKDSRESAKAQKELRDAMSDTTTEINKEKAAVNQLGDAVKKAAIGSTERAKAIKRINDQYGTYLPKLLTEKSSNEEVATALNLVNAELEKQIRLKGRMNAMSSADEALQTSTKSARASFEKQFKKLRGRDMTSTESAQLLQSLVEYRDIATSDTASSSSKQRARSNLITGDLSNLLGTALNDDQWIQKVLKDLFGGIDTYNKTKLDLNALYGKPTDLTPTTYDHSDSSAPEYSSSGGGSPDKSTNTGNWSLSGDASYLQALYELKEQYRQGDIASEEEYRKKILDLEISTLQGRIDSEKESGAELLALKSQLTDKQIERQKLDGKKVADNELKLKEEQYKLERAAQEARNAEELATTLATGQELEALKKEHARKLAAIDLQYLQDLKSQLEALIGKSGNPDEMTLDGSENDALKLKLQELKKEMADIIGMLNGSSDSESPEDAGSPSGGGQGSLFGVSQDAWSTLFQHIAEGKFTIEDLKTSVEGLQGVFNEMFSYWASASEIQAAKEKKQFKEYEKQNESRKKSLEKRLNAGLITEAQYNAEIERMDAEKDAYQEEMELKQAKRQKTQKLTQSIINTALGVTKTLADWGIPWGIAPAAIMGAMGAAQTAMIAAQPITTGAEEGGFIDTTRAQDGKKFKARLSPDKRGFVSGPTVLVGENGGEYVIPAEGLANPSIQPFLATMEAARRNGTLKNLNFDAIYPASSGIARASGGYTVSERNDITPSEFTGSGRENTRLAEAIESLERRLSTPITAEVSMLGRNGIIEKTEDYNRFKKRGTL